MRITKWQETLWHDSNWLNNIVDIMGIWSQRLAGPCLPAFWHAWCVSDPVSLFLVRQLVWWQGFRPGFPEEVLIRAVCALFVRCFVSCAFMCIYAGAHLHWFVLVMGLTLPSSHFYLFIFIFSPSGDQLHLACLCISYIIHPSTSIGIGIILVYDDRLCQRPSTTLVKIIYQYHHVIC